MKNKKKYIKYIGNIITLLAVILIIRRLISYEVDYAMLLRPRMLIVLGGCLAAYVLNVILGAIPWLKMVEIVSNKKMPYLTTTFVHVRSNLLKYIPGNVFQYIGKNELAVKCDVGHVQVALSTILDVLLMLAVATVLGGICIRDYLFTIITTYVSLKYIAILGSVGIIFLLVAGLYLKKKKESLIKQVLEVFRNKRNVKNLLECVLYYVIQNIWVGGIYVAMLLMVSGNSIETIPFVLIIGANIFSGVIGLITPGAPGGLGIREVVMALITQGVFIESAIMLTSVIYRVITVIGDGLAFLVVALIVRAGNTSAQVSSAYK